MLLCALERTLSRLDSQRHYVGFVKLDGWKGGVFLPSLEMPGGSGVSWRGWGAWRCTVLIIVFIHCCLWPVVPLCFPLFSRRLPAVSAADLE